MPVLATCLRVHWGVQFCRAYGTGFLPARLTQPLPIVGYINPLVADALRDPTSGINTTQLRAEPNAGASGAVVMKADADAVIAKLHGVIGVALEKLREGNVMWAKYALIKALK